jgi:hypothetical protein
MFFSDSSFYLHLDEAAISPIVFIKHSPRREIMLRSAILNSTVMYNPDEATESSIVSNMHSPKRDLISWSIVFHRHEISQSLDDLPGEGHSEAPSG